MADSNTLLVSLVLILVRAGEVVLDDGGGDPFQPGLGFVKITFLMMLGFQKGQNHFCSLSEKMKNNGNEEKSFFSILTATIFQKLRYFLL